MNFIIYFFSLFISISLYLERNNIYESNNGYSVEFDSLLYPNAKHREQSKLIYQLLSKYHYKKINLDDSLSEKILKKYINSLDPNKRYLINNVDYFAIYIVISLHLALFKRMDKLPQNW